VQDDKRHRVEIHRLDRRRQREIGIWKNFVKKSPIKVPVSAPTTMALPALMYRGAGIP
jgi:hypothetical protein